MRILPDVVSEDLYEIAIQASPHGVVVCDESGAILFVNSRIEAIFGYTSDDLIHSPIELLLPETPHDTHRRHRPGAWRQPSSPETGRGREWLGRRRDGSAVPVEVGSTVAIQGTRRLIITSVVDITERKRLELDLERAAAGRLAFEEFVARLAMQFVNLPHDDVDGVIVGCQHQLVEVLDIDHCAIWALTDDGSDLLSTHIWSRPDASRATATVSARESIPGLLARVRADQAIWISGLGDVPGSTDRASFHRCGTRSMAMIPMRQAGSVTGAISFGTTQTERTWLPEERERLRLVAAIFSQALARRDGLRKLHGALEEVERLRDKVARENIQLRHEVMELRGPQLITAESPAVRRALEQLESVAATTSTVLLQGETGSGKEVFAQTIHAISPRGHKDMIRVNCAAIPTALIESELFGRERGAYTGALSRQIGRFELADGSTIFLDEIGDLPLEAQSKLLRVLQEKVVERLGGSRPISVDVRIIAATNHDLGRAVAERTFREDLYYRLNVFPITVPPLRERPEDIPVLVWTFIDEFARAFNRKIESISREDLAALQRYSWPGNIRELRNVIERAVIVARGPRLVVEIPGAVGVPLVNPMGLAAFEADHIRKVLDSVGWRVRGSGGAAEILGMKPTTLDSRMSKLGIRRKTISR